MSHTLQVGVVLDGPPIVVDRAAEGGPARAMARSLTGAVIVSEVAQVQDKSRLHLLIGCASDAQRVAIETAINTAGARTVNTGVESVTAIPAERSLQKFTPLVVARGVRGRRPQRPAAARRAAVVADRARLLPPDIGDHHER